MKFDTSKIRFRVSSTHEQTKFSEIQLLIFSFNKPSNWWFLGQILRIHDLMHHLIDMFVNRNILSNSTSFLKSFGRWRYSRTISNNKHEIFVRLHNFTVSIKRVFAFNSIWDLLLWVMKQGKELGTVRSVEKSSLFVYHYIVWAIVISYHYIIWKFYINSKYSPLVRGEIEKHFEMVCFLFVCRCVTNRIFWWKIHFNL